MISEDEDDDDVLLDNHDLTKNIEIKQKATVTSKGDVLYTGGQDTNNTNKFSRVKNQIDDVIDTVRTNISKVLDRGTALDELHDRSEDLSASAATFNTRARYTRKALWMRTCRARLYLGGTIFVIVGLLMFFLYRMFKAS